MTQQSVSDVGALLASLKHQWSDPSPDLHVFLRRASNALRATAVVSPVEARVECLIEIAALTIHAGGDASRAIEPISLAVLLARQFELNTMLRRALSVQCAALNVIGNVVDSLKAAAQAIDLARSHAHGTEALVLRNVGLFCDEFGLHHDALAAFNVGLDRCQSEGLRSRLLSSLAICLLRKHDLDAAANAASDALRIQAVDDSHYARETRGLAWATQAEVMLALGRAQDARSASDEAARCAAAGSSQASLAVVLDLAASILDRVAGAVDIALAAVDTRCARHPILRATALAVVRRAAITSGQLHVADAILREIAVLSRERHFRNIVRRQELYLTRVALGPRNDLPLWFLQGVDNDTLETMCQSSSLSDDLWMQQVASVSDARERFDGARPYRVARIARLILEVLSRQEQRPDADALECAARLHDVGRLVLPPVVFDYPPGVSACADSIVESHTSVGAYLIARSRCTDSDVAEQIARHHHERFDGQGGPDGLMSRAIPLSARIVRVADNYEAKLFSGPDVSPAVVAQAMRAQAGADFDPDVINCMESAMSRTSADQLRAQLDAACDLTTPLGDLRVRLAT